MRVTYYVAASLDGYTATLDGGVAWLDDVNIPIGTSGYEEFFATVDGLVMGRKTYEQVCGFGDWPYGSKPTWVCSRQDVAVAANCNFQGTVPPVDVIARARSVGIEHLWTVGGGTLAAAMLREGLLTHVSVATMPILLGSGIPLFVGLEEHIPLALQGSREFATRFVQHDYRPVTRRCAGRGTDGGSNNS